MNYNKKDYIIHNGKRYYAEGGIERELPSYFQAESFGDRGSVSPKQPKQTSDLAGHQYYRHLSPERKKSFLEGRGRIYQYIMNRFSDGLELDMNNGKTAKEKNQIKQNQEIVKERVLKETGIDLNDWRNKTNKYRNVLNGKANEDVTDNLTQGFNAENDRKVYKYLSSLGGNMFTPDSDGDVRLGANVVESVGKFYHSGNLARRPKEEVDAIRKLLLNSKYSDLFNDVELPNFTRAIDTDGNKYYTIETNRDKNGNSIGNIMVALDKDNNVIPMFANRTTDNNGNVIYSNGVRYATDDDDTRYDYIENWRKGDGEKLNYFTNNDTMYSSRDDNGIWDGYNNKHTKYNINANDYGDFDENVDFKSLGGRTTRYYAVGGTTGEQIPIGEVEQPNDYNMIGEGGSHEQNPMGGVPYGVNQDGTQNMVEEGEVSVGNNVFSDRTQMSPELCQQLGLPEGTTPAQAMQQIETLYEQGQIGDEEFQEIQQIIFQDQEAQKQGAEDNIAQMQQEMPSEGIQPNMMQGASMPPEMIQQSAPPMQPPMQQGAAEGIQPEMVQGYGFGGRRWGCR